MILIGVILQIIIFTLLAAIIALPLAGVVFCICKNISSTNLSEEKPPE